MRSNIEGVRMRKTVQEDAESNLVQYMTTGAGPITITPNSPPILSFDPGVAAVNVVFYTPNPAQVCPMYTIINRAAATGTLVLKQADGSTTFATVATDGKIGVAVWDGATWRGSSLP
jgi:hypothetical protein